VIDQHDKEGAVIDQLDKEGAVIDQHDKEDAVTRIQAIVRSRSQRKQMVRRLDWCEGSHWQCKGQSTASLAFMNHGITRWAKRSEHSSM
jgi:hypothetical protein